MPSEAVTVWRGLLIAAGVLMLLIGAATFVMQVPPTRYPGVVAWLAAAIVVHDGIAAMLIFAVAVLLRRLDHRIPAVVLAIVQAAAVVVVVVTAVVLPEIVKQAIGTANPTILPLDYARHLGWFAAAVVAVSAVSIAGYLLAVRSRRRSAPRTR